MTSATQTQQIRSIMTEYVLTVTADTPFTEACRMFNNFSIHHLPVVENNNEIIGLFSFTDAMRAFNDKVYNQTTINEKGINNVVKIDEIMTAHKVYTLGPDDDIKHAITLFKEYNIHSIPIAQEGKLVGILTTNDIINKVCD